MRKIMTILFLDDNEERHNSFSEKYSPYNIIRCYTAGAAIIALKSKINIDLICLDHDLGGEIYQDSNEENTGYQVAKFIAENNIDTKVIIHSMNTVGAKNMQAILPKAIISPVFWLRAGYSIPEIV